MPTTLNTSEIKNKKTGRVITGTYFIFEEIGNIGVIQLLTGKSVECLHRMHSPHYGVKYITHHLRIGGKLIVNNFDFVGVDGKKIVVVPMRAIGEGKGQRYEEVE